MQRQRIVILGLAVVVMVLVLVLALRDGAVPAAPTPTLREIADPTADRAVGAARPAAASPPEAAFDDGEGRATRAPPPTPAKTPAAFTPPREPAARTKDAAVPAAAVPQPSPRREPERPATLPADSGLGAQAAARARELVGAPYAWGGVAQPPGFDNSGFSYRIYRDLGVELPRGVADQAAFGVSVASPADLRPGDLVFFAAGPGGRTPAFLGVYVGADTLVWVSEGKQAVVSAAFGPWLRQRFLYGRRP